MSTIVFFVVVVIAIAVLWDFMRSHTKGARDSNGVETANEAMPTQTGRFRAQQALGDAIPLRQAGASQDAFSRSASSGSPTSGSPSFRAAAPRGTNEESDDLTVEDEDALPDPFDRER